MKQGSGSLREFITVIFKYKRSIFWVWSVTVITILIGNQVMPPIYEAESTLMVNFGREYLYSPEVGNNAPYNYYDRSGQINSEIEILSSRALLEDVVKEVGIDTFLPPEKRPTLKLFKDISESKLFNDITGYLQKYLKLAGAKENTSLSGEAVRLDKAVVEFAENLTILGGKDSNIIRVGFQHKNPEVASQAVNILIAFYQRKHLQMFRDKRVFHFLEDMVEKYSAELKEAEKQYDSYRQERAANSTELQEEILVRQRGDFDSMLKERESDLKGLTQRLLSLQEQKASMSESTPLYSETKERDRVIDNTKAELLTLRLKEEELLGTYRDDSPEIANVRSRIRLVEAFLMEQEAKSQSTVRIGKSAAYQDLERDAAITAAEKQELTASIDSLKEKLSEIDDALYKYLNGDQKMKILEREKNLKEKNYLTYIAKLEEARINGEMDDKVITNIKVVHKAVVPHEPVTPKKILNIIIGIFLGLFAGVGISFFRNHVNQGINSPENMERRINLPVLATVSYKRK